MYYIQEIKDILSIYRYPDLLPPRSFAPQTPGSFATKQVPLCYVIMSRRTTPDYKAVFSYLKDRMLPNFVVKEAVMDY